MFSFTSIEDYHSNLLSGNTTCVEAVEYYLHSIHANKYLNAFLEVYYQEALEKAASLDEHFKHNKSFLGKLHGVVIGLKDVICYKGHKISASSKILQEFTSVYNATVTNILLNEGAIIIGRQNCDEFAMGSSNENSAFGNVLNARDNSKVSGGSSGGSAVSVQAGLCMISLGSDTGGSVRQPADFCGIIGLKPSYGKISRYGLIAYASSFDQIGIFGNTVDDVAKILKTLSGPDNFDSTVNHKLEGIPNYKELTEDASKCRIAYFKEALEHPALDPEIASGFKAFIKELTFFNFEVQAIDFELLEFVVPAYYILTTAEASSNLSRYDGIKFGYKNSSTNADLTSFYNQIRSEGFGKEVKRRIMLGTFVLSSGYYEAYYTKAQKVRRLLVDRTSAIFENFDAILSPTVPSPAFPFGEKNDPVEMFLADIYTVFANLVGIPAISLPLFTHKNGMPFGMQVMTSKMNELFLLSISKRFMQIARKNKPR